MKKTRLAFIGTYPEVSKIFLSITSTRSDIIARSIDASFERAAELAAELAPELDAILSRGATAEYIQKAVNMPVIYIPITPFDVVKAIHNLPPGTEKIAVIHYRKNVLNISELEALYHLKIHEYHFNDYDDIDASLRDANEKGIKVVIGGAVGAQIAKKYGMTGIEASAGYEAVSRAITECLQVLEERDKERARSAQLSAAFSSMAEGIIILDANQR